VQQHFADFLKGVNMRGETIRVRRSKLRSSQFTVAKLAGISRNRLSLIECSYAKATSKELMQIKIALDRIKLGLRKSRFFMVGKK